MEHYPTSFPTQDDLESIIDLLDDDGGEFPSEAIDAARRHAEAITPLLIRCIDDAVHDLKADRLVVGEAHFYAAYLLTEFRAVEAWPSIREAISLPDQEPYELFGDGITQDFCCVIATLAGEGLNPLSELVANPSLDLFVRWVACEAVLYRVRDGLLTKNEAIDWFASSLEQAIGNKDEIAEGLIVRLVNLGAKRVLPLIEQAYTAGIIDEQVQPLEESKACISQGEEIFAETMDRLIRPDELIDRMQRWTTSAAESYGNEFDHDDLFGDDLLEDDLIGDDFQSELPAYSDWPDDELVSENEMTIRNRETKIGRNEKCPCGSGKKYKKCCMQK